MRPEDAGRIEPDKPAGVSKVKSKWKPTGPSGSVLQASQPSTSIGRKLRFAMMPISWIISILVVYGVFLILAAISSTTISGLLHTSSLWPLAVFLPAFFFGKVLGLIILNLVAHSIPAAKRVFESEVAETGRHSYSKAMKDLSKIAFITGAATLLGAGLFLFFRW